MHPKQQVEENKHQFQSTCFHCRLCQLFNRTERPPKSPKTPHPAGWPRGYKNEIQIWRWDICSFCWCSFMYHDDETSSFCIMLFQTWSWFDTDMMVPLGCEGLKGICQHNFMGFRWKCSLVLAHICQQDIVGFKAGGPQTYSGFDWVIGLMWFRFCKDFNETLFIRI